MAQSKEYKNALNKIKYDLKKYGKIGVKFSKDISQLYETLATENIGDLLAFREQMWKGAKLNLENGISIGKQSIKRAIRNQNKYRNEKVNSFKAHSQILNNIINNENINNKNINNTINNENINNENINNTINNENINNENINNENINNEYINNNVANESAVVLNNISDVLENYDVTVVFPVSIREEKLIIHGISSTLFEKMMNKLTILYGNEQARNIAVRIIYDAPKSIIDDMTKALYDSTTTSTDSLASDVYKWFYDIIDELGLLEIE